MKGSRLWLILLGSNLSGCMLIGSATMPDARLEPKATVSTTDTRCAGVRYRYRITLSGKNYIHNIHGDPLGFLLLGRWYEVPFTRTLYSHALEGEIRPAEICIDGYVPSDAAGFVRFVGNKMQIALRWPEQEAGRESNKPRLNGSYELEKSGG